MTAGPDEKQLLRVLPGGATASHPADPNDPSDEESIREDLRRMGVGPDAYPPRPPYPPTVPGQPAADADQAPGEQDTDDLPAPARAANDRLPFWYERRKPDLADLGPASDEPAAEESEPVDEQPDNDEPSKKPEARGPRRFLRRASKSPRPADGKGDDGGGERVEAEGEDHVPAGPRWSRPLLGRPPGLPPKRDNLFTWWRSVEPHVKWGAYHGTGLAAGVYFGVAEQGFRGAEFVTTHDTGSIDVLATYGLLAVVLLVDYRVRNLIPPLAWAVRGVSTSLIIGALWYGAPLSH
ncbi:hypothetical protein ACFY0A_37795 [Streptomyces sp. NPDC001698]|uniref:hypothetical protein n=1 Tax=Streptomyces sp. NPDC001698 TaxID=3364601 RepID=UPI0036A6F5D6